MTKPLLILGLLVLAVFPANAQQKPAKPPVKKAAPVKKKSPGAEPGTASPVPPKELPAQPPVATRPQPAQDLPSQDELSEAELKKIEAQNTADLARNGERATYYRMNRNSLTVLPVHVFVPGLGEVDKKTGKAIYTPQQLFKAKHLKSHGGDVLMSEKYFQNKIQFDTEAMMAELLADSTNFNAYFNLKEPLDLSIQGLLAKKGKPKGKAQPVDFNNRIREYLTEHNVGTDILNIWTNRSILMERIYYSLDEADNRERVDPKKLAVFENLLRRNYVLVLVMINPRKIIDRHDGGYTTESYVSGVEGYLYKVAADNLDGNNIQPKQPLEFVKQFSLSSIDCDPRSEELMEVLGGSSIESLRANINTLMASSIRKQAQVFYNNKDYACAKNYYEYLATNGTRENQPPNLRALIEECDRQLGMSRAEAASATCLVSQESVLEDWVFAQGASNNLMKRIETGLDEFKIKSFVFKSEPYVTVEIGKKQGVYTDQRFLVYRKSISEKGKESRKRIATLRAVKVADNTDKFQQFDRNKSRPDTSLVSFKTLFASLKKDDPGPPKPTPPPSSAALEKKMLDSLVKKDLKTMSVFKQVDGGHIEPYDLIEQNEDKGIGVQVGYGTRLGAPAVVLEWTIASAMYSRPRMPLSGLKVGFNVGLPNSTRVSERYDIPEDETMQIDLYLAREFICCPNTTS